MPIVASVMGMRTGMLLRGSEGSKRRTYSCTRKRKEIEKESKGRKRGREQRRGECFMDGPNREAIRAQGVVGGGCYCRWHTADISWHPASLHLSSDLLRVRRPLCWAEMYNFGMVVMLS